MIDAGPCPYLPGRHFHAFVAAGAVDAGLYRVLLDNRFRRNGTSFYRPSCPGCEACTPIRVAVAGFAPRRDQRRAWRHCADLTYSWHTHGCDAERLMLWRSYQAEVHGETVEVGDPAPFLVEDGGIPGGELHARDAAGRLLAVSVCDVAGDALSSVYCYWEPSERRRGLGTVMALAEIREAARQGLRWWYPGFWVADCPSMAYKARFGPAEALVAGCWQRVEAVSGSD